MSYIIPALIDAPMNHDGVIENISYFLTENAFDPVADWTGFLSLTDQRRLFGFTMGEGEFMIHGLYGTVYLWTLKEGKSTVAVNMDCIHNSIICYDESPISQDLDNRIREFRIT